MSLLDELDVKARKIREDQARQDTELKEQEAFYTASILPAMLDTLQYFSELVEKLNLVAPDIRCAYPLDPGPSPDVYLQQLGYHLDYDNRTHPRQIILGCRCQLKEPHKYYLPTQDAVLKHTELLDSYEFRYHRKDKRDQWHDVCGATFELEGPMNAYFRIVANPEKRCVNITLRNLENTPIKHYRLSPEQLGEALLKRLVQILLREEQTLIEVAVSEEVRGKLRRQVEADRERQERDLALAYAELEAQKRAEAEARPSHRVKSAVRDHLQRGKAYLREISTGLKKSGDK